MDLLEYKLWALHSLDFKAVVKNINTETFAFQFGKKCIFNN
jgi:hypothetical protein